MAISSELPFDLGETLKGKDSDGNLINSHWLGKEFVYQPRNKDAVGVKGNLTGRQLRIVALRNTLGAALLGKRAVLMSTAGGYTSVEDVTGYGATHGAARVVAVDPYLDSNGCADDDIFWGIVDGVTTMLTSTVGADFKGDIAVGSPLVCGTGTTTGSTSEGRVSNVTLPGTTGATTALQQALNVIGTALSARTTGETNSDILVHVKSLRY